MSSVNFSLFIYFLLFIFCFLLFDVLGPFLIGPVWAQYIGPFIVQFPPSCRPTESCLSTQGNQLQGLLASDPCSINSSLQQAYKHRPATEAHTPAGPTRSPANIFFSIRSPHTARLLTLFLLHAIQLPACMPKITLHAPSSYSSFLPTRRLGSTARFPRTIAS